MERTKIYKIIFSLFGFILMLSGVSYAYFITKVSNNETTSTIASDAANLELEFKEGTNQISASDIFPGWYASKTFTVTNKSSISTNYSLYISDIVNPLIGDSLSYKIESLDGGFNKNKTLLSSSEETIQEGIYIQGDTTHTYTITTYYNNLDINQSADKGKSFSYKIYIKGSSNTEYFAIINDYDYTGTEQTFTAIFAGLYRLEVWGAQGGYGKNTTYRGGYGGYSKGEVSLNKGDILYVNVGGSGGNGLTATTNINAGGYNGGGNTYGTTGKYVGSGGGATHIATQTGVLSTLANSKESVLIVAGGGGGGAYESTSYTSTGGDGGGIQGNSGITTNSSYQVGGGGTQTAGGATYQGTATFGIGASATSDSIGGGGGFYGGGSGKYSSGSGGGSGYIGNLLLSNKVMYCYNCSESADDSTKTISTTCTNTNPTSNCSKEGGGYAKITFISD